MQLQAPKLELPAFPHISIPFLFNTPVLIIFLALFFIVYAIISSILVYHWAVYGMRSPGILIGRTIFLVVSGMLFVVSGLALTYL